MEVTMLLCDSAQECGGKLNILGGGWSMLQLPNVPTNMALAVKVAVPWDQTNRPLNIRASLITADGEPVEVDGPEGDPVPIQVTGQVTVGRPPHVKPGTDLDLPFVLPFNGVQLGPGGYVWLLEIDGEPAARTPFRVLEGPIAQ